MLPRSESLLLAAWPCLGRMLRPWALPMGQLKLFRKTGKTPRWFYTSPDLVFFSWLSNQRSLNPRSASAAPVAISSHRPFPLKAKRCNISGIIGPRLRLRIAFSRTTLWFPTRWSHRVYWGPSSWSARQSNLSPIVKPVCGTWGPCETTVWVLSGDLSSQFSYYDGVFNSCWERRGVRLILISSLSVEVFRAPLSKSSSFLRINFGVPWEC